MSDKKKKKKSKKSKEDDETQKMMDNFANQQLELIKQASNQLKTQLKSIMEEIQNKQQLKYQLEKKMSNALLKLDEREIELNNKLEEIMERKKILEISLDKINKFKAEGRKIDLVKPSEEWETEQKQKINLIEYDLFKNDIFMSQRKAKALKSLSGLMLVDLALWTQDIVDLQKNQFGVENNQENRYKQNNYFKKNL